MCVLMASLLNSSYQLLFLHKNHYPPAKQTEIDCFLNILNFSKHTIAFFKAFLQVHLLLLQTIS